MTHRQDFFMKKLYCRQNFENKCAAGKMLLTESYWVLCPVYVICKLRFTNHRSEASFSFHNYTSVTQSTFVCPTAVDESALAQLINCFRLICASRPLKLPEGNSHF